jgi:Tol biopolymer transport system component
VTSACRIRWSFVVLLAAFLGSFAASCGGGGGKPRPDLLFVSTRDKSYEIFGMDADGSRQRRISKGGGDASTAAGLFYEIEPAWSPDGKRIAFSSKREGSFDIFVMTREGKDVTRLTTTGADDSHPTWSPDGKRIAFARSGRIDVMSAEGSGVRGIGPAAERDNDPAWSPDGRWIAYTRLLRDVGTVREIWLMRPDGSGNHALTSLSKSSSSPAWSPDSARLAFSSDARGGRFSIFEIGADGKGLHQLTSLGGDDIEPAWSPDGKTIAFSREGAIVTAPVGGGEEQTLTDPDNNDSSPDWNPVERRR